MQAATLLFIASATVIGTLGSIHGLYTFYGNKLHPRDAATLQAMQHSHPVLTRETTVWKATLGFNASHSLGAILFALVFGYLAGWHGPFLKESLFLQGLGLATLLVYWALARRYWFSIPRRGIALTCALYALALLSQWMPAGV
ncbi:MAG: hypothetical protein CFE44_12330 [Burkholderiales bacterium PBB4]|nr:MAG: hypothetical protein CFE44_12330 [Burkholderiales bacterium PBB4]